MKRRLSRILGLFVLACNYACVQSQITSLTYPPYANSQFNRILVVFEADDLIIRKEIENQVSREISQRTSTQTSKSHETIFPKGNFSDTQIQQFLSEQKIDAILTIRLLRSGAEHEYVPRSTTTVVDGLSTGYLNEIIPGTTHFSSTYTGRATTFEHGGYLIPRYWARFNSDLIHVNNKLIVWTATVGVENAQSPHEIIRELAWRLQSQMQVDGVLSSIRRG